MRLGAVIAAGLAAGLVGCAASRPHGHDPDVSPARLALRQQWSQAAQAAIDGQDWPRAEALLGRLLLEEPRSAEVHHRLGLVLQAQGRLPPALASYRRALEIDHDYVDALIGLGEVEARLGRPREALDHIDAAIELDPRRAPAHLARGRTLEALGRADEALAAYFRVLEDDPSSAPAMLRVAALQLGRGLPDQALARLDLAIERVPDDPDARHLRGRAHLALNHVGPAVDDLQVAAARLPDRPDVFCDLALALDASQRPAEALQAAERALRLAPESTAAQDLSRRLRR